MKPPRRSGSVPVVVTTARISHTDDIALRQRRYAATQGVRLLCIVLAVALPVPVWGKLLLCLGALALPWFGVVAANAGPTRQRVGKTALVEGRLEETLPRADDQPLRLAIEPGRVIDAER
ncbi:MAG: DUF3099 domain-containing protein [Actinomycetota bacterium]|nr:DUF3099 domain-containing protein [Actinomycetota bacterium]